MAALFVYIEPNKGSMMLSRVCMLVFVFDALLMRGLFVAYRWGEARRSTRGCMAV